MRFLYLDVHFLESLLTDTLLVGGIYNWHRLFEGEVANYDSVRGTLTDYDVVFISLTTYALEARLLSRARKEIGWHSKTKIVATVDYCIESWQQKYEPFWMEEELLQADALFAANKASQSGMNALLCGQKDVALMPHPTDIDKLRSLYIPRDRRKREVVIIRHSYDNNFLLPFLACRAAGVASTIITGDPSSTAQMHPYFNRPTVTSGKMSVYANWVRHFGYALDSYHWIHSYGRFQVDNAAFGIPTVGTNIVSSQAELWPDLTTDPGDVSAQAELLRRLFDDEDFAVECCDKAWDRVQRYGYQACKEAFLGLINNPEVHSDGNVSPVQGTKQNAVE